VGGVPPFLCPVNPGWLAGHTKGAYKIGGGPRSVRKNLMILGDGPVFIFTSGRKEVSFSMVVRYVNKGL